MKGLELEFLEPEGGIIREDDIDTHRRGHKYSDVNEARSSLHHTLGWNPYQAAPGQETYLALVPVGAAIPFFGDVAPKGWVFCNGQAVNIKDMPQTYKLFGANKFGTDTSTQFQMPDMRNRFPRGLGSLASGIGDNEGATEANRTIRHTHGAGTLANSSTSLNQVGTTTGGGALNRLTSPDSHSHSITGSTGQTANTEFPYIFCNYIMRKA